MVGDFQPAMAAAAEPGDGQLAALIPAANEGADRVGLAEQRAYRSGVE